MRKLTVVALTVGMLFTLAPAFAQDTPQDQYKCQLQAGTCLKKADTIQRKMKKLDAEIAKGKKTYSAEDLKKIEDKLKEVEQMLDNLKAK